jgi:putative ATP-dependent endonuclease of OLD family
MRIRAIEVRRFRSIERGSLTECGGLNVMIGKNNSGKSNLLATIDLVHRHLWEGSIAGPWPAARPLDEFTDRQPHTPLQIGIECDLPSDLNKALRERLQTEAPHLERSIEQIRDHD